MSARASSVESLPDSRHVPAIRGDEFQDAVWTEELNRDPLLRVTCPVGLAWGPPVSDFCNRDQTAGKAYIRRPTTATDHRCCGTVPRRTRFTSLSSISPLHHIIVH